MLTLLVTLLVISLVSLYLLAPLLIRLTHKQPANPEIERIGADEVTPRLAGYARRVADSLASQGFAPATYMSWPGAQTGVYAQMLLLTNQSERECATVVELCVTKPGATGLGHTYVEFCTEFVNGEEINTYNGVSPQVTKPDPLRKMFRFPAIENPLLLYGAHRQLVERHSPAAAARFIPTPGTEHLHAAYTVEKVNRRQVEFGYLYLDEAARAYRPTLKGAFLMTWKLVWPVKQVREALTRRAATATLRSLGA